MGQYKYGFFTASPTMISYSLHERGKLAARMPQQIRDHFKPGPGNY
jgi:hypothetical protein